MFIMPAKGRLTSPFGMRNHPISKQRAMHWGIDIGGHVDNSIVASAAGRVRFVSRGNTGYGYYVIITHSNGWETLYAHLASISVAVGNSVKQGQRIGTKGTTGNSTGIHLHFEIHAGKWNNRWSKAVNPLNYISDSTVKRKQELLVNAGYKLVVDGIDGPATLSATKAFQKANKLVVDGIAGVATLAALNKVKNTPKGKRLYLPKTASAWRVYPTNKTPVAANALSTRLNPKKFGGLDYEVLGNPQKDVYTIKTGQLGTVNIYAGPGTGAVIK